jgi:hypothetical protein
VRPLEEILAMWEELTAAMRVAYRPYNLQLFELLGRCCGDYPRCLNEYKCFFLFFVNGVLYKILSQVHPLLQLEIISLHAFV